MIDAVSWYERGEPVPKRHLWDANIRFVDRNHTVWASGGCEIAGGFMEIIVRTFVGMCCVEACLGQ